MAIERFELLIKVLVNRSQNFASCFFVLSVKRVNFVPAKLVGILEAEYSASVLFRFYELDPVPTVAPGGGTAKGPTARSVPKSPWIGHCNGTSLSLNIRDAHH